MTYEFLPTANFLGLAAQDSALATSQVIVLPIPYELTTSYGQGTRQGPRALLHASQQVELYDREFDRECALDWAVHTLPSLAPTYAAHEAAHAEIAAAVAEYGNMGKLLCVLGG